MKTGIDCIPCLLRQVNEASGFVTEDKKLREHILRDMLGALSKTDLDQTPQRIIQTVHRYLRSICDIDDPYRSVKDRFNSLSLKMLPLLRKRIENSSDPFYEALKVVIAGNAIDCGAKTGLTEADVQQAMENSLAISLEGDINDLRHAAKQAKKILYIADNAGEIVFDRILIERLGQNRVILAVRGLPVINDATEQDARAAGLHEIVEIINNGSDAPGTILEDCSEKFRKIFNESDLIISKGQGNYETLCQENANIFFLLKIKCQFISDNIGLTIGTHTVIHSKKNSYPTTKTCKKNERTPQDNFLSCYLSCKIIGIIHSEHTKPHKTPIQPVYAKDCRGSVQIFPEYADGLRDIEGFSHIYLIYHLNRAKSEKLLVKPFLDDTERGVFATRAPVRPNPIGLSIVELISRDGNVLYLKGLDVLDGTPLIDIKPYVGRFDCIVKTRNGWQDLVDEETAQKRGIRGYEKDDKGKTNVF